MTNGQVTQRRSWLARVIIVIAYFNIVCSILWLVARFLWAKSSVSFSVTTDQKSVPAPFFMIHIDISSGAILDALNFIVAVLFLVAAFKKWTAIKALWILFTMAKGTYGLALLWRYCYAETLDEAQLTTVCLGRSPLLAIALSYINMLCAVWVFISLWTQERGSAEPFPVFLDQRPEAGDCPPTYEDATQEGPPSLFMIGSNATNLFPEPPPPPYTAFQMCDHDHV